MSEEEVGQEVQEGQEGQERQKGQEGQEGQDREEGEDRGEGEGGGGEQPPPTPQQPDVVLPRRGARRGVAPKVSQHPLPSLSLEQSSAYLGGGGEGGGVATNLEAGRLVSLPGLGSQLVAATFDAGVNSRSSEVCCPMHR